MVIFRPATSNTLYAGANQFEGALQAQSTTSMTPPAAARLHCFRLYDRAPR
jgi:hypothetical protein